jgi:hypothetical protein
MLGVKDNLATCQNDGTIKAVHKSDVIIAGTEKAGYILQDNMKKTSKVVIFTSIHQNVIDDICAVEFGLSQRFFNATFDESRNEIARTKKSESL